jgi:hypothetical protein
MTQNEVARNPFPVTVNVNVVLKLSFRQILVESLGERVHVRLAENCVVATGNPFYPELGAELHPERIQFLF